jgi:hypothetical protein
MSDEFGDIFNNLQKSGTKKKHKEQPAAIQKMNEKSKVIGIRFPYEDIEKLKKHFKLSGGSINLSAEIRKIVYQYMDKEGIL